MRKAFTLTELLVSIMVIAILASTVVMTMYQATERARERRAQAEVAAIGQIILDKWGAYRTRPVRLRTTTGQSIPRQYRTDARQMAHARLRSLRDIMRQELPDRISDVADGPPRPPRTHIHRGKPRRWASNIGPKPTKVRSAYL